MALSKTVAVIANDDRWTYNLRKELIEALLAEDCRVTLIMRDGPRRPDFERMGCSFIDLPFERHGTNPLRELRLIGLYRRILSSLRPDVVLSYTIKPNIYGGLICAALRIPFIANVTGLGPVIENGGLSRKAALALYRAGLRKAACVFFQNRQNMRFMLERGVARPEQSRLLPGSGVNLEEYGYRPYPDEREGIRFLFIGRIMRDKGVGELLYAAEAVKAGRPDCRFRIIGDFDEDYSESIRALSEAGVIEYLGFRTDVGELLADCHCVILPSYHEGTANVLLEAAASGRPVIATRVEGCAVTYEEGLTGLGCEAASGEDLKRAILDFLALGEERHRAMGLAGRAKMEREFDRGVVIASYLDEIGKIRTGE